MSLRRALSLVAPALIAMCACLPPTAIAQDVAPAEPPGGTATYAVGGGDVLTVTVYNQPNYSGVMEVAGDGTIPVNVIGKVQVAGLTPPQVGAEIARRLRADGIFRDPVVNVMVQNYRSNTVFVLGSVAKPGEYPLERGSLTVTQILSRAGATLGVGGGTVRILHRNGVQEEMPGTELLNGAAGRILQPQDTVIVTETATFYIAGEVQRAGSYPLEPGLTMERAIALAGGVTQRGARSQLKVTRSDGKEDQVIKPKLREPVQARDMIMVGSRIF
ncbi:MAG: polysaccharide biosynthesis/export family protein [Sphingobium sp.]